MSEDSSALKNDGPSAEDVISTSTETAGQAIAMQTEDKPSDAQVKNKISFFR